MIYPPPERSHGRSASSTAELAVWLVAMALLAAVVLGLAGVQPPFEPASAGFAAATATVLGNAWPTRVAPIGTPLGSTEPAVSEPVVTPPAQFPDLVGSYPTTSAPPASSPPWLVPEAAGSLPTATPPLSWLTDTVDQPTLPASALPQMGRSLSTATPPGTASAYPAASPVAGTAYP